MKYNLSIQTAFLKILILISISFISSSSIAGQYIKIENIDVFSLYPKIKVLVTINGIDDSHIQLNENNIAIIEDGFRLPHLIAIDKQDDTENLLYLVISVDSSKSISKKYLKKIKSSVKEIVSSVGPKDKVAVFRFNDKVVLLNDFSKNHDAIIHNINSIERHGTKTLLYNSIYESIEVFDKIRQINKKIIVFTDGKDEGSSTTDDEIIQFARDTMIPVYFICFKDSKNIRTMAHISKLTGGKLIYSNTGDICGMYRTVLSLMKNRYSIIYSTNAKRDGNNHRIEVRLKYNDIRDRDYNTVYFEKVSSIGALLTNSITIIGLNVVLLALLIAVTLFFLYREKKLVKIKLEAVTSPREIIAKDNAFASLEIGDGQELDGTGRQYTGAWVYQKNGSEIGKKYALETSEIRIGSDSGNTIVITNDSQVSKQHTKIKNANGIYTLYDLISDDGTYLNGKKLLRPKILHDWDEIKIGSTVLIFRAAPLINK